MPDESLPNESLGDLRLDPRFAVHRRLGSGSFGVVYEVFDQERGERVALKALVNLHADALYRFKREFRSLADVRHPNIIRLYELLSSGSQWYFTMELIDGERFLTWTRGDDALGPALHDGTTVPVSDLPSQAPVELSASPVETPQPPDMERLRNALPQLARGVQAIHEAGKLHRDLKSSNVLVRRDGRLAILDFGVVGDVQEPDAASRRTGVVGTPSYMAPEQVVGQTVPASDWYAVGVMLYEALTGSVPFLGSPLDVLAAKQRTDPVDPRLHVPGLPDDLCSLCLALLRRDPTARPTGAKVLGYLGDDGAVSARLVGPPKSEAGVLGRAAQQAQIEAAFDSTTDGRPVVVHLLGSSGMGKTVLMRHCLDELVTSRGAVLVEGRCFERESVPYKAFDGVVDAMSRHLLGLPTVQAAQLMPRDVGALVGLFPVLEAVPAFASAPRRPVAADPRERLRRAFAALRELTARAADRRPLIVAIDDLQWGDADSARLLAEVLRMPEAPAVLLVLACRSEETEASRFLQVFDAEALGLDSRTVEVGPLDREDARSLAIELLQGDPEDGVIGSLADSVAKESAGNPFFIEELVHYLRSGTADRLRSDLTLGQVLAARLERLPAALRELLEVIALAGRPITASVAALAAELEADWHEALDTLQVTRLVRLAGPQGKAVESIHDRVRETVVSLFEAESLRGRHGRLAAALEASGTADPEWLASHFAEAGDLEKAAQYATAAAAAATEALAFDRAAQLYGRALELRAELGLDQLVPDQLRDLYIGLGESLARTGRGAEAAEAYLQAAVLAESDPALRLECRRRATEHLLGSGHVERGMAELSSLLTEIGTGMPTSRRRALLSIIGNRLLLRLRGFGFEPRDEDQIAAEELFAVDVLYIAAVNLALVDTLRGASFMVRGLKRALRAGELTRVARALSVEAGYQSSQGGASLERARRLAAETERIARELDEPLLYTFAAVAAGFTNYFSGRFREAAKRFLEAEMHGVEAGTFLVWETHHTRVYRLASLHYLGALQELGELFDDYVRDAEQRGDLYTQATLRRYFNGVWLARDDPERARRDLARTDWPSPSKGYHLQHWLEVRAAASIDLYCGPTDGALERFEPGFADLSRSLWIRSTNVRLEAFWLRGRLALVAGELRIVKRMVRRLRREKLPHANVWADLLRAGLAIRGDRSRPARDLLRGLVSSANEIDLIGCAAAAQRRLGELVGGSEGKEQRELADAAMRDSGVQNPERMVELVMPC